ncbi:hypothetical protein ACP70R_043235 [Stipagrostis hirtigluma subsp. patula]
MQSVLRSAAGRAAGVCGRRGYAATAAGVGAGGERERVVALVQQEVRAQLRAEEERALLRAEEAELRAERACLRAEQEARWKGMVSFARGFWAGAGCWFVGYSAAHLIVCRIGF